MPTECTPKRFEFEAVARRAVLACADGRRASPRMQETLLLGQVDRGLGLMRGCSVLLDPARSALCRASGGTLVGQRILASRWATRTLSITTDARGPDARGAGRPWNRCCDRTAEALAGRAAQSS